MDTETDIMSVKAALFLSACGVAIYAMLMVGVFVVGMFIGARVYNLLP